jgi:transcriptional/translational regulatory protein YebC/TACO1
MERESDTYVVKTSPSDFHAVQEALRGSGIEIAEARLVMNPRTTVRVEGRDAEKLITLLEALEDQDDVQHVYSNLDIDEALLAELAGASQ